MNHHIENLIAYGKTSAGALAATGSSSRWSDLVLRPAVHFCREYFVRGGFLDGRNAFLWEGE